MTARGLTVIGLTGCLVHLVSGCVSNPGSAPRIVPMPIAVDAARVGPYSIGDLTITDLNPAEGTILTQGTISPFSVGIKIAGPIHNVHYILKCRTQWNTYHDADLSEVGHEGELNVSASVTWFIPSGGNPESVTVSLYRKDTSPSGATTIDTLVHQETRDYRVMCDPNGWRFLRWLAKVFGHCG